MMREMRGRMLFLPSILVTQVAYLGSVWVVAPAVRQMASTSPFVMAITLFYAVVFLAVYFGMRLLYWERLSHVDDGRGMRMFGVSLPTLFRRTGTVYVDLAGLILSAVATLACGLVPALQVLVPLLSLCLLAFLGAVLAGKTGPWEIRRRGAA